MPDVQFKFDVPDDLEAGSYANMLNIWHTAFEFTLDFAVLGAAEVDEEGATRVPARVVARVRVPPTMLFDILQTLNRNLEKYEKKLGPIPKPTLREEDDA